VCVALRSAPCSLRLNLARSCQARPGGSEEELQWQGRIMNKGAVQRSWTAASKKFHWRKNAGLLPILAAAYWGSTKMNERPLRFRRQCCRWRTRIRIVQQTRAFLLDRGASVMRMSCGIWQTKRQQQTDRFLLVVARVRNNGGTTRGNRKI